MRDKERSKTIKEIAQRKKKIAKKYLHLSKARF
jgi:hypothetical protein